MGICNVALGFKQVPAFVVYEIDEGPSMSYNMSVVQVCRNVCMNRCCLMNIAYQNVNLC